MTSQTAIAKWIERQIDDDGPYESLRDMSHRLKIPLTTLSRIKNGGKPRSDTLERLAAALRMKTGDFLQMVGQMEADPAAHDDIDRRIITEFHELSPEDQNEILELMRFKAQRRRSA